MKLSNFHTHCDYCDGAGKPSEYAEEAVNRGFLALGFSSHAPISFEKDWTIAEEQLPAYLSDIDELKSEYAGKLEIYRGLEIDYLESLSGPASPRFVEMGLDYIIGSVHMIPAADRSKFLAIDGPPEQLTELLEKSFNGSAEKLSARYYSLVRDMVGIGGFEILGHIDLIKKRNSGDVYFSESEKWYKSQILETLEALKGTGIYMEVNTGGISRGAIDSIYPSPWILKEASAMEIPLVLSADAHVPEHIDFQFNESVEIMKECGYKERFALDGGKWVSLPL